MSSRVSIDTPDHCIPSFDQVVTQWMSPSYDDGGRVWISSQVQVVGVSIRPSIAKVHDAVSSFGVTSAVSTGQLRPVSYWPGGRRGSRSACARPLNPRVNFIARLPPPSSPSASTLNSTDRSDTGGVMQTEDLILISVDDHVVEPPSLSDFFADHVEAKYKDRVPRVIRRDDGSDAWLIEGKEIASFGLNAVQGRPPENWGTDPASFDQVRPGTYDVNERVRDMNANGVLGSLNFSSWPGLGGQFFTQSDDDEFVSAILQAYNDWNIEAWCGAYPGRF